MNALPFLKIFGQVDGLLKGTVITSNLITVATIAIIPGFGVRGLVIATTIQMLASSLISLPAGFLADYYGRRRCLKLALILKIFVTIAFLFSLLAARLDLSDWIWFFFSAEAIIDSFASSFLNGSYQAAFMDWYSTKIRKLDLSISEAPPLFLASFHEAFLIRFLLPISVAACVLGLQFLSNHFDLFGGPYAVAFVAIGIILFLRIFVFYRISKTLGDQDIADRPVNSLENFKASFFREIILSRYFPAYAIACLVNALVLFYLTGQAFKLLSATGLASALVWVWGIFFGLSIYLIRTAISTVLFKRLSLLPKSQSLSIALWSLAIVSLLSGAIFAVARNFATEILVLLTLCISLAVLADACQRVIESSLFELSDRFRATWLTTANAVGMLCFGIVSALLIGLDGIGVATPAYCLLVMCISMIALIRFSFSRETHVPFSLAIRKAFLQALAGLITVVAIIEILNFSITSMRVQKRDEQMVVRMTADAVREPAIQGSFVEASKRLQKLQAEGAFYCARLKVWDFKTDLCAEQLKESKMMREYSEPLVLDKDGTIGFVQVYFDQSPLINLILYRIIFTVLSLSVCALILFVFFRRVGFRLQNELKSVLRLVQSNTSHPNSSAEAEITIEEFKTLGLQLQTLMVVREQLSRQAAFTELATQVSHDIRSPLAALQMVTAQIEALPEDQQEVLRTSAARIQEIANTLLKQKKETISLDGMELSSTEPLAILIEQTIAEKRLEFKNRPEIAFEFSLTSRNFEIFSKVQVHEFRRILSNLINNSVESITISGKIAAELFTEEGLAILTLKDNGRGMPPEILSRVGTRHLSHGKHFGTGLGLWHAKKTVESWGGSLAFDSQEGIGTVATLCLKTAPQPDWFISEIVKPKSHAICILDDDASIHEAWKVKFNSRNVLRHFYKTNELESWVKSADYQASELFLVDFRLPGSSESGLDLIERLGIAEKSILVTSRYDDLKIRQKCEHLGVKILPKILSDEIPRILEQ